MFLANAVAKYMLCYYTYIREWHAWWCCVCIGLCFLFSECFSVFFFFSFVLFVYRKSCFNDRVIVTCVLVLFTDFFLWRWNPTRVMASSFFRFLDHRQRRTTVGRTLLDEWSACRRDLFLTTQSTLTTDKHPCPRWDSNPQSQQASGRRPTP